MGGLLSLAPAAMAMRNSELAAYHGAQQLLIGSYEHSERRAREHERCRSQMLGPLVASSAVGSALAARAPRAFASPARLFRTESAPS